jgi:hypothetical protein
MCTAGTSRVARGLLAAVLLLLVAGCQARVSVSITTDADGAGQLAVSVGADADLLADAATAGADPLDALAASGTALEAQGWRTTDVVEADGSRTVTLSASFDGPEAFNELAEELMQALAAPELTPLAGLRMQLDEEEIRIEGVASLEPTPAVTELGLQPEQAVTVLREADAVRYDIEVALPGEVRQTTGTRDGDAGPLRWRVAPGERVEILAVGDRPATPWWFLALSGGLGGVAALLLLQVVRRRRPGLIAGPSSTAADAPVPETSA